MPAAAAEPPEVKSNEQSSLIASGDLHSRNGEWERAVAAYSKVRRPSLFKTTTTTPYFCQACSGLRSDQARREPKQTYTAPSKYCSVTKNNASGHV
jgi:hypothetical protein